MAVTIRDVAAAAGVSMATVSRVLSGSTGVDPEMAARVRAASERLGYRANLAARALRRRVTDTVGMVVPDLANPFFPIVVQSVEAALRERGMSLLLCDARNDVEDEATLIQNLIDHQIDGLVVSAVDRIASRHAIRLAGSRVPLVQLDRLAVPELPYVGAEQEVAIGQLVDHLADAGCRRFVYVSSSLHISTARDRMQIFIRRLRALDPDIEQRVLVRDFSLEWGRDAAQQVLGAAPWPDAVVCANDLTAVGVLQVLHEHGVKVPAEIIVTGFDDTVLAVASQPPLTTVRQPLSMMGLEAVTMLRAMIDGGPSPTQRLLLPTELVIRQSSGRSRPQPSA